MLENVRYKIANHFARKALEQIENGEIIKGMKNFKRSFWLPLKKQPLLWRGERCVTHFSFFLLSLSGKEAFSWPEAPSWRAVFRTGSSRH